MSRADGRTAASRRRPSAWRWPVHPRPGEAFTSWLQHSARQNEVKLASFVDYTMGDKTLLTRDMDKGPNLPALARLAACCALDEDQLRATTLRILEGRLSRNVSLASHTRWVLPVTRDGVAVPTRGQPFCGECLAEGDTYSRLTWRLSFAPMCLQHRRVLHDACPFCLAPVMFHRLDAGFGLKNRLALTPVSVCWHCQLDLREAHRCRRLGAVTQTGALKLQTQLLDALKTGTTVAGARVVSALDFATVVYALMKAVSFGSRTGRLQAAVSEASGVRRVMAPRRQRPQVTESLGSVDRAKTLALTGWLLEDWPSRLQDVARQAGVSRSVLIQHVPKNEVPTWFSEVLLALPTGHGRPPKRQREAEQTVQTLQEAEDVRDRLAARPPTHHPGEAPA